MYTPPSPYVNDNIALYLLDYFVIDPLVNAATEAASDANVKSKHECRYFYVNYNKDQGKFSTEIQNVKAFNEMLDSFDLYQKSKLHLSSLGSTKFQNKEYGIYFNTEKNSMVLVSFF
jgi:hypothetical protein